MLPATPAAGKERHYSLGGPPAPFLGDGALMTGSDHFIAERWDNFRALARSWLHESCADALLELPPLTADQRRVINHSVLRAPRVAPRGRQAVAVGR